MASDGWTDEEIAIVQAAYREAEGVPARALELVGGRVNRTPKAIREYALSHRWSGGKREVYQEPPPPLPAGSVVTRCRQCGNPPAKNLDGDYECFICGTVAPVQQVRASRR